MGLALHNGYVYSGSLDNTVHKIKDSNYKIGNRISPPLSLGGIESNIKTLIYQLYGNLNGEKNQIEINYDINDLSERRTGSGINWNKISMGEEIGLLEDLTNKYLWTKVTLRQHHDEGGSPEVDRLEETFFEG